jgi:hypothetical protein
MATFTIAYSNHRPEALDHTAEMMRRHQVVFLEEAPDPLFSAMLEGQLSIDDYVAGIDTEYPDFSRMSCRMIRRLNADGTHFEQVEPFIERLIEIHELFASGATPDDILKDPVLRAVYAAEKEATRTLIDFYDAVVKQPFDLVLTTLKAFARADASRFRLRDGMRADAVANRVSQFTSYYIEAGSMHLWLRKALKRRLSRTHAIFSRYPMAEATRALTGRTYLMGPGDDLTLSYIYNPQADSPRIDRLAARSLIFNKMVTKMEISDHADESPHTKDEWRAMQKVNMLQIQDCAVLFSQIRTVSTSKANAAVDAYLES